MAITRVQIANFATPVTTNSQTITLTAPTTAGNALIVEVILNDSSGPPNTTIVSVTDDAPGGSNTYTQFPNGYAVENLSANFVGAIWYSNGIKAGAQNITIITSQVTEFRFITALEYSGVATSSFIDDSQQLSNENTTPIPSPTLTLTNVGDVMGTLAFSAQGSISVVSPGTASIVENDGNTFISVEDFPNTMGSYHETFTGSNGVSLSVAFALKPAAGTPTNISDMFLVF